MRDSQLKGPGFDSRTLPALRHMSKNSLKSFLDKSNNRNNNPIKTVWETLAEPHCLVFRTKGGLHVWGTGFRILSVVKHFQMLLWRYWECGGVWQGSRPSRGSANKQNWTGYLGYPSEIQYPYPNWSKILTKEFGNRVNLSPKKALPMNGICQPHSSSS